MEDTMEKLLFVMFLGLMAIMIFRTSKPRLMPLGDEQAHEMLRQEGYSHCVELNELCSSRVPAWNKRGRIYFKGYIISPKTLEQGKVDTEIVLKFSTWFDDGNYTMDYNHNWFLIHSRDIPKLLWQEGLKLGPSTEIREGGAWRAALFH